ncbi:hypothetical protein HanRHA438_Chr17g0796241 [Helianthus annuus]|nr:hypothetical protein HanRHA438_Chr17g0796241 [Helianthus annuus]
MHIYIYMQSNKRKHDLQLEVAKLAKEKFCCGLDVLFEEFLFLFIKLGGNIFDVILDVSNKLLLVERGLFLQMQCFISTHI